MYQLYLFCSFFVSFFADKNTLFFNVPLVVKVYFFAIIVLSLKRSTEMSTEKVTRYRCFTFMQYLKHPDTGEELYSEDKVIKA